jgi:hypothetical protein
LSPIDFWYLEELTSCYFNLPLAAWAGYKTKLIVFVPRYGLSRIAIDPKIQSYQGTIPSEKRVEIMRAIITFRVCDAHYPIPHFTKRLNGSMTSIFRSSGEPTQEI